MKYSEKMDGKVIVISFHENVSAAKLTVIVAIHLSCEVVLQHNFTAIIIGAFSLTVWLFYPA